MKATTYAILVCVTAISCGKAATIQSGGAYNGAFVSGEGDTKMLEAIDAAFASTRPSALMVSLPMFYKRDWNGFVEAPSWPCWWSQNSFGATYSLMPFLGEEPYASWICNAQGMWFRLMGDGKRMDNLHNIGPDGCLCDAAAVMMDGGSVNGFGDFRRGGGGVGPVIDGTIHSTFVAYKQGDCSRPTTDFYSGATVASLIMEADRLLARHDPDKARLEQLKRVAAFLDSRRDPETNLIKGGHNCNLLAPSFRGVPKPDGTFEFGYLTELSVNHIAAMERLAEVCALCGEPEEAAKYRAIAQKVRAALPRLMTSEGYFIRSDESDGRHGVFGAATHGYFESHPNHDAGAFRVTDDAANARIVNFMLDDVKGKARPGSLVPHGFILPNYPWYDEPGGGGGIYGNWCNGGVWPANEGAMGIACFRAGRFDHPFKAWDTMRPLMEAFRSDAPLSDWGLTPWSNQTAKPYCFCYDDMGVPGGILRGLFEYQYTATGVRLWPHIPPRISRYVQKIPSFFGQTKIFITTTGTGALSGALVNGTNAAPDKDGSLFLPLDGTAGTVTVEFLLGGAKSRGVPAIAPATVIPPATDKDFWIIEPKLPYAPATSPNDEPLRIGGSPDGGVNFPGQIKDVRIYSHALSEAEAAARTRGEGNPSGLLAEFPLNAAGADGDFAGAVSRENAAALSAHPVGRGKPAFKDGGITFASGMALDVPSSSVVDFFEDYTLEAEIRPTAFTGGRILDRSTGGGGDGILFDLIASKNTGQTLRLISPWGTAKAKVTLRPNEWNHVAATCSKEGLLRLFVDGAKIAEVQGKTPVPQPRVMRSRQDLSPVGVFLSEMEKAGMGDSFEAGQARIVVEMIVAYHERQALEASGKLIVPDLRESNKIPPADGAEVDKLYRDMTRWILGGLQDHLNGLSLAKYPVKPEVLDMARTAGLISK